MVITTKQGVKLLITRGWAAAGPGLVLVLGLLTIKVNINNRPAGAAAGHHCTADQPRQGRSFPTSYNYSHLQF